MAATNTILVTGATGQVGRHVVAGLLDHGYPVRALTRNPATAGLPSTVEVVGGDLARPDSLKSAVDGVEQAFLMWPYGWATADDVPAVLGLLADRARHVVVLSSRGIRDDVDIQADPNAQFHADIERLVEESGLDWTFLRPGGFSTNTIGWAPQIRATNVVRAPFGALARPLIHERDIAAVAVHALTAGGQIGEKLVLTGPRALTQIEQARIIGAAIGQLVRWVELSPDEARPGLLAEGWSPDLVDGALRAWASILEHPELPTSTVPELTGAPARTFADWASDHAADFR